MSKYGELEDKLAEQVRTIPELQNSVVVSVDPSETLDVISPSVVIYWEATETEKTDAIAGNLYCYDNVIVCTEIVYKSSGVMRGDARELVYDYLDKVKSKLIGFMPNVENYTTLSPMETVAERFYKLGSDEVGVLVVWALKWKYMGGVITA